MTQPAPLLEATDLSCTIAGRNVWQDLHLQLNAGEGVGVTGPSGSGKTLLLRTLVGLNPWGEGKILWRGEPIALPKLTAFRADIIYLPQRPSLPDGSVETALAAPFELSIHRDKRFSRPEALEYLKALAVEGAFLDQDTASLSGGEAQLVSLVRAMLLKPSVLLLDEPTASLDGTRVRQVESLLSNWLHAKPERAFAYISHDPEQIERLCSRHIRIGTQTETSTTLEAISP
ncbi:ABC transporter ATP-binding protein [Mangrovitalea sediminis]|uniref:ABC transporter ATP-binding protein n=1 Tax=Mangrovitalea sediminis TaxID=1982043 RepID=UPI000BE4E67D|nr:ATP-binding cassette domain-containing protein [Mangrovitalea sediminis]